MTGSLGVDAGFFGKASSSLGSASGVLKAVGFKAILCWHYLVLFSPVLVAKTYSEEMQTLFTRQFPMYVSMSLAFGLLMLFGKKLVGDDRPSRKALITIGVLGVLATLVSVVVHPLARPIRVASVLFLGPVEAVAMFVWLRFYVRDAEDRLLRQFAIDMIFGGVTAFLICNFMEPLNYAFTAALPLVAMVSLDESWPHEKEAHAGAVARAAEFGSQVAFPGGGRFLA